MIRFSYPYKDLWAYAFSREGAFLLNNVEDTDEESPLLKEMGFYDLPEEPMKF